MIETIELFPGVSLRCFRDSRFKQGCLSFQLVRQMCEEEAALNALLPTVLQAGVFFCGWAAPRRTGWQNASDPSSSVRKNAHHNPPQARLTPPRGNYRRRHLNGPQKPIQALASRQENSELSCGRFTSCDGVRREQPGQADSACLSWAQGRY